MCADEELSPLKITVAGARGAGKTQFIEVLKEADKGEPHLIKARVESLGLAPSLIERLKEVRWTEFPGYARSDVPETKRDRYQRESSVAAAADSDLLVLVIDGSISDHAPDIAFAHAWDKWFREHPHRELPPTLVVVTGMDRPEFGGGRHAASQAGTTEASARESLVRAQLDGLRAALPPTFHDFITIGLGSESPFGLIEHIVPTLAPLLLRAERTALLRRLQELSGQSKVGRLVRQLGEHGRSLWGGLKARHNSHTKSR